jgi:hypothetical protein
MPLFRFFESHIALETSCIVPLTAPFSPAIISPFPNSGVVVSFTRACEASMRLNRASICEEVKIALVYLKTVRIQELIVMMYETEKLVVQDPGGSKDMKCMDLESLFQRLKIYIAS